MDTYVDMASSLDVLVVPVRATFLEEFIVAPASAAADVVGWCWLGTGAAGYGGGEFIVQGRLGHVEYWVGYRECLCCVG